MTDGKAIWLIEHRRTTRREAKRTLLQLAVILPVLLVAPCLVLQGPVEPGTEVSDFYVTFFCLWYGILAAVTTIMLFVAWLNWKADGEFVCRLSAEWLECRCPLAGQGESFRIAVTDIDKLSSENGEASCNWYVWDQSGRRFWLTSNYRNPDFTFVQKLRELRPELQD